MTYLLAIVALVGIGTSLYLGFYAFAERAEIQTLQQDRDRLLNESATQAVALKEASSTIHSLQNELTNLHDELEDLADDYRDEKNRNEDFEDQIRELAGTVVDLDKLAKTDEELLQKYSKVYFLNENYIPERLTQIDSEYILEGKKDQYFHARAMRHLENLFDAAADDNIDLKIVSAYRSFETQSELKGQYTQVYGSGANTFSADQGYSEHQLGTAVDLTTPLIGGAYETFATDVAYEWLRANAHKYGFILSYPSDNTYYVFEPWHWRFVGVDLASDLNRVDAHFYDWEQRKIDEYLLTIFD